jgi:hypothetical protein
VMMRQKENPIIKEPGERETMNGMEIITVRVAGKDEFDNAMKFCAQVSNAIEKSELMYLSVYYSAGYSSDLSVHLNWPFKLFKLKKSLLGLQFARGLSDFGIVSHTLWIDQHIIEDKNT